MITHTVSVVELLWTTFCLVGLVFNARQLRRAVVDVSDLRRLRINSIREYAAITTVLMFLTWTITQFMFVLVGAIAMTSVSPNNKVTPTSYVITVAFILISALFALAGYVIDIRRSKLIEKILEIEDMEDK